MRHWTGAGSGLFISVTKKSKFNQQFSFLQLSIFCFTYIFIITELVLFDWSNKSVAINMKIGGCVL